ncbi:HlyC/CorC family transporter [Roseiconus nitratireducens]|uniref:HlyC/CorC family transporter n=1 Tax=Roseiconus nitratireducens TaxID=2605748 RepID=A0A5M6CZ00_9BACT|nr:hemolysin family protein [Roseiconus nitratireducens]KAA5540457.1 HlyC/CorC family transporter [Roseiconus nitratireducens]
MTLLIIYLCVAIGFSFYCSVAEAVLLSITPSFTATLQKTKPADAVRLKVLKENIDRPLAAILSLNTIAHTIGAAGVGAQAAVVWGSGSVAIASAVMTLLILIFSEIIPKTIGALYWRSLAPLVGKSVMLLIWMLYPLVWISEKLTKLLSGGKVHHSVTREELHAMAEIGAQQGVLAEDESRIFRALMRFPQITVADIMTPRVVVIAFPQSSTVGQTLDSTPELRVTRIPIYDQRLDDATNFVLASDLLLARSRGENDRPLSELGRELATIADDTSAKAALDALLKNRQHIALVLDQFGSAVGIVTLEDVIETLLGLEIVDEQDTEVDMQTFARERWRERAKRHGIELPEPPTEE